MREMLLWCFWTAKSWWGVWGTMCLSAKSAGATFRFGPTSTGACSQFRLTVP